MRKIFIVVIVAISIFTACQATPEETIVVGKNNDALLDKAQADVLPQPESTSETPEVPVQISLRERLDVPEVFEFSGAEKNVTVEANADIHMSDAPTMDILRVREWNFTQEIVSSLWRNFVGDTPMFYTEPVHTKSEIEEMIINIKAFLERSTDEELIEYNTETLNYYNGIYDSAPESKVAIPVDGTLGELFYTYANNGDRTYYEGVRGFSEDDSVSFILNNGYDSETGRTYAEFSFSNTPPTEHPVDMQPEPPQRTNKDITDTTPAEGLSISPADATTMVNEFLQNSGLPFEAIKVIHVSSDTSSSYSLRCARFIDTNNVVSEVGGSYESTDAYTWEWPYEYMQINVNDEGIRQMFWSAPIEITETAVERSSMLPFSDIRDIFEKMMPITYTDVGDEVYCEITEVRLEYVRILEQNSQNTGLLVPAWNFYGIRRATESAQDATSEIILLCVNGVDGSIIDRGVGY